MVPSAHGAHVCARSFEGIDQKYENVFYHADQFLKGAYSLYLVDWLRAFGRHRLLILRAEDYWADTQHTLKAVFAFLGVRPLSLNELQVIAAHPVTYLPGSNATFAADGRVVNRIHRVVPSENGHTQTRVPSPMPEEAAKLLRGFYGPLNAELAALLRDERFLWRDS